MPIESTYLLYQFDELSDKAKAKAREWFREGFGQDTYWAESVIEDAERMGTFMGITFDSRSYQTIGGKTRQEPDVSWSLGYCQNDFAAFDGSYEYARHAAKKISKESGGTEKRLIEIANRLQALQKPLRYSLTARVKYHHYYGQILDAIDATTSQGYILGISVEQEKELKECFRDFSNWIYRSLRTEYEYQTADEQVDDGIRANEYTFLADGKRED